jgi:hypothetical protein
MPGPGSVVKRHMRHVPFLAAHAGLKNRIFSREAVSRS